MKCPSCEKAIASITIKPVDGRVIGGSSYKCVAYNCPLCQAVLSVQIDPVAIKTDLLTKIKALLGRG